MRLLVRGAWRERRGDAWKMSALTVTHAMNLSLRLPQSVSGRSASERTPQSDGIARRYASNLHRSRTISRFRRADIRPDVFRPSRVAFEPAVRMSDIVTQVMRIFRMSGSPYLMQQQVVRHQSASVMHKHCQKPEFDQAQMNARTTAHHLPFAGIDGHVARSHEHPVGMAVVGLSS